MLSIFIKLVSVNLTNVIMHKGPASIQYYELGVHFVHFADQQTCYRAVDNSTAGVQIQSCDILLDLVSVLAIDAWACDTGYATLVVTPARDTTR